jgi:hypothetical protein
MMDWQVLLASSTDALDQALLLRHEYLVTENHLLRNQIEGHMRLSDGERKTMTDMTKKPGKQASAETTSIVMPGTSLASHPSVVARKFTEHLRAESRSNGTPGSSPHAAESVKFEAEQPTKATD